MTTTVKLSSVIVLADKEKPEAVSNSDSDAPSKGAPTSLNLIVSLVVKPCAGAFTVTVVLDAVKEKGFNPNNLSLAGYVLAGLAFCKAIGSGSCSCGISCGAFGSYSLV